jgi:hypothetical protein
VVAIPEPPSIEGYKRIRHMIDDANHLLAYAVQAGIEVEPDVARKIVTAEHPDGLNLPDLEIGELIAAMSKLASKLYPVTSETLRACREDAHEAIRFYQKIAIILGLVLLPTSIVSGINSGLARTINDQIGEANALVVELHSRSLAPVDQIAALQQITIRSRNICKRAWLFNLLNLHIGESSPSFIQYDNTGQITARQESCNLQLPPNLYSTIGDKNTTPPEIITSITFDYQIIRQYATNVLGVSNIISGAIGATVLPVLYAVLGACGAVLRVFTQQLERRTFSYTYASPARFIIAAIGGGVIGLFNVSFGEGLSVSPLALAFLVGYSADVFFSFLEKFIPRVTKSGDAAESPVAAKPIGGMKQNP